MVGLASDLPAPTPGEPVPVYLVFDVGHAIFQPLGVAGTVQRDLAHAIRRGIGLRGRPCFALTNTAGYTRAARATLLLADLLAAREGYRLAFDHGVLLAHTHTVGARARDSADQTQLGTGQEGGRVDDAVVKDG